MVAPCAKAPRGAKFSLDFREAAARGRISPDFRGAAPSGGCSSPLMAAEASASDSVAPLGAAISLDFREASPARGGLSLGFRGAASPWDVVSPREAAAWCSRTSILLRRTTPSGARHVLYRRPAGVRWSVRTYVAGIGSSSSLGSVGARGGRAGAVGSPCGGGNPHVWRHPLDRKD